MSVLYDLRFYTPWGLELDHINEFVSLQLVRKTNEGGVLTLELDPTTFDPGLLTIDGRIEVWRAVWGYPPQKEGSYFLIRNIEWGYESSGLKVLKVEAEEAFSLIKRRICDYPPAENQVDELITLEIPADNVLKELARENFGSLVTDTARDWSALISVEEDKALCPLVKYNEYAIARRDLFTVMREFCDMSWAYGRRLFFDLVGGVDEGLTFATFIDQRGFNHGQFSRAGYFDGGYFYDDGYWVESGGDIRVLSRDNGSLTSAKLRYVHDDEATAIYTAGNVVGTNAYTYALDVDRIGKSPFGRIERVADAPSDINDLDLIQQYSDQALYRARPRRMFEGTFQETPNMLYGVHFGFGDIVVCKLDDLTMDVHVDTVQISNANGLDRVEFTCRNEIYTGS